MNPPVPPGIINIQKEINRQGNIDILYGNVTTFGVKAKSYLFAPSVNHFNIVCGVESHIPKEGDCDLHSTFEQHHFKLASQPAEETGQGGCHGGEFIACRKHIDTCPIDLHVYEFIKERTGAPVRFCAVYIRFKMSSILLVTTYFWCSGLSDANFIGDFNIKYEDMIQSGWLNVPKLNAIKPEGLTSTSYGVSDRVIDYVLVFGTFCEKFDAGIWDTLAASYLSYFINLCQSA